MVDTSKYPDGLTRMGQWANDTTDPDLILILPFPNFLHLFLYPAKGVEVAYFLADLSRLQAPEKKPWWPKRAERVH